jgi:hypothetical protein
MSIQNLPEEFEELDFLIEEEGWNEYDLQDGSRIRARVFLKKINRDPQRSQQLSF